jgi:signal transduction histidine kinase
MPFGIWKYPMHVPLKLKIFLQKQNLFIFFLVLLSVVFTGYAFILSIQLSEQVDTNTLTKEALIFQRRLQEKVIEQELLLNALAVALDNADADKFKEVSARAFQSNPHFLRMEQRDEAGKLLQSENFSPQIKSAKTGSNEILSPSVALNFSKAIEQQKCIWALSYDSTGKMVFLLITPSGKNHDVLIAVLDPTTWIHSDLQLQLPPSIQFVIQETSAFQKQSSNNIALNLGLTGLDVQLVFKPLPSRREGGNLTSGFIAILGLSLSILLIRFNKEIVNSKKSREQLAVQEMALAKQAQLSTLGEISTTLAHELNQPLATITNYIATCEIRLRQLGIGDAMLEKALNDARGQALRAADIVVSIRKFLHKGSSTKSVVEIENSINNLMPILNSLLKEQRASIRVRTEPLLCIYIDPALFEQIIFNLCKNGLDAMADTPAELKKLTLQTSLEQVDNGDFCVQIKIEDAGHGIAPDDENKIFSPFFTTKSEGMGIGLSLVKSLTERHGGRISWKKNPDRGVTFILQFPQYTKSV